VHWGHFKQCFLFFFVTISNCIEICTHNYNVIFVQI
jgi:hypothetical protein